jgi:hypothetical protein
MDDPIDLSGWLKFKRCQPPPCAPNWVYDKWYTRVHLDDDWFDCAWCGDHQAAGLLPPSPLGGPILIEGCTCAEQTYKDWKWVKDKLWEDERQRYQAAACQFLINKDTPRLQQEAACCQQLLDERAAQRLLNKRAAYECQEAAHRQ